MRESSAETHSYVNMIVQSCLNGFKAELRCLVLRKIVQDISNASMRRLDIRVPPGIKLADPNFMEPSKIDMLIGAGIFWDLLCVGQIKTGSATLAENAVWLDRRRRNYCKEDAARSNQLQFHHQSSVG